MIKYCIRRIGQMLPTLAGVILITFVLFNMVGGSPAALVLGEHASPESLDEFDRQHGFDLPLFFGKRLKTRLHPDTHFSGHPGIWNQVPGAQWNREDGTLVLKPGTHDIPLMYSLPEGVHYEWRLRYRLTDGAQVKWQGQELRKRIRVDASASPHVEVYGGDALLQSVTLRRLQENPFRSQLTVYLAQLLRLDFGVSTGTNQRVAKLLKDGIGPSLALTVPVFFGGLLISLFLALMAAYGRDTLMDRLMVIGSVALMSVNYIVWIVAGQYLLGFRLGWFPVWGFESWRYLLLPVGIGIASGLGANVRFYRTVMLDEMYRDYVRTGFALGLSRERVLFVHVLKNAMIPVLTNVIIAIPFLYTGSLLLESFFGIPGLGYLSVNAVNSADVAVIRAIVLIGSVLFMAANLMTDICYAWVDPRVRLR